MSTFAIVLIVIGAILLVGPIMYLSAKLNKVDPFIRQRENLDELLKTKEGERSYIITGVFYVLFSVLWFEKYIIDKIKKTKNK